MPHPPPRPVYEFGTFSLDANRRILLRDNIPVPLEPKVLETLLILIENQGRVLTKDELLRKVWDGAIVEEGGLTRNISILRKVLGERPDDHQFIVTRPGQGYHFVAKVRDRSTDDLGSLGRGPMVSNGSAVSTGIVGRGLPAMNRPKRSWIAWAAAAAVLILGVQVAVQWWPVGQPLSANTPSGIIGLTSTSGFNTEPALTRDGTLLAYASDRGGMQNLDIWIQAVGGRDPIQRTSESADETEPSFSPDDSQIVFSRRNTGIYLMGALAGEPRLVAAVPWGRTPRVSPDGKWIVF